MKTSLTILLLSLSTVLWGQISYKGHVGKYPIELLTDIYSDGDARAVYAYTRHDTPIPIDGELKNGRLELFERNDKGEILASLLFKHYQKEAEQLVGQWIDKNSGKTLDIVLQKEFEIADGKDAAWSEREIMQRESLKDYYFKLLITKTKGDHYPHVSGVKILEKKTDRLLQHIKLECQLLGMNNISVGDFNFDGVADFSVYELGAAGPNTSSKYFLYDPEKHVFFDSGFGGISLTFDSDTKTIQEWNQCCAGTSVTTAVYKVVNNKMVLIEEHCFKWDEALDELVERGMRECR